MSRSARILLGVLASLGVAGLTLGLLVVLNRPEQVQPTPDLGATAESPPASPPAALEPAAPEPDPPEPPELQELKAQKDSPGVKSRPRRRPVPTGSRPVEGPDPPAEPADTEPPKLAVLAPRGHAVVMTPKLLVRVRSEAGAEVTVDGQALAENSPGLFAINLRLSTGRNLLTVTASDAAGNQRTAQVRATYIDPARYEKNKAGFVHLLEQLDEVRAAAAELDRRISELVAQLDDAIQADQVSLLSRELRQIRATRNQIEAEVGRAIQEIDTLMARGAP